MTWEWTAWSSCSGHGGPFRTKGSRYGTGVRSAEGLGGQQHPRDVCMTEDRTGGLLRGGAEAELKTLAGLCKAVSDPPDGPVVMSTLHHCLCRLRLKCSLRNPARLVAVSRSLGIPVWIKSILFLSHLSSSAVEQDTHPRILQGSVSSLVGLSGVCTTIRKQVSL